MFSVACSREGEDAVLVLVGELDATAAVELRDAIAGVSEPAPGRLVLKLADLLYMASAGLRTLVFARQKMPPGVEIVLVSTQHSVRETLELTGFLHSVTLVDSFD